jgi:hypothetical protein
VKLKESKRSSAKMKIDLISRPQTPDEESEFNKAIDLLLAELVRQLDQNNKGDFYEIE